METEVAGLIGVERHERTGDGSAIAQLRTVADGLRPRIAKTAALLEEAAQGILA